MDEPRLLALLQAEIGRWCGKSADELAEALREPMAYERGSGADGHQFEVNLLEKTDAHVHILVSIDDGSFRRACRPLSSSFIVHRDGRIER